MGRLDHHRFRAGTEQVKLVIIPSYQGKRDDELLLLDFKMEVRAGGAAAAAAAGAAEAV